MKKLIFLLIILISITSVYALELTPQIGSTVIVKEFENPVKFNVTIDNMTKGTYNFYTLADVNLEPRDFFQFINETVKEEITITPTPNLRTDGYYTFTYILNHRDVEKIENQLTINIVELEDIIEIGSDSINTEESGVRFYVENSENVKLEDITATFSSILFEEELTFTLGPNQKLYLRVPVEEKILATTQAGVYKIDAIFKTLEGEKTIEGNIYIGETKGITTTEDISGLIIKTETIQKVNTGNVLETVEVEIERSFISRFFTSFNIKPNSIERNGANVKYTFIKDKLNPGKIYTIKAETNYLFPILIIIFAIITIIGFKRYSQTKIDIEKKVHPIKTKNGEFALKITLKLKARDNIENVTLIDKVPAIVKIYNKFGTLRPDKIDPESRRLHWNLGDLNSGEVRILNYIVYSKVGIVGKFSLPSSVVVFESLGKIHETTSNTVFFLNEQSDQ